LLPQPDLGLASGPVTSRGVSFLSVFRELLRQPPAAFELFINCRHVVVNETYRVIDFLALLDDFAWGHAPRLLFSFSLAHLDPWRR
jgi:hypothetical protein